MTKSERGSLLEKLNQMESILKFAEDSEITMTVMALLQACKRELNGEAVPGEDVLRRISAYIQGLDEAGERQTSILEIQRGCELAFMSHTEKIHAARQLQQRGFQRKLRYGPDGRGSWYYAKQGHAAAVAMR